MSTVDRSDPRTPVVFEARLRFHFVARRSSGEATRRAAAITAIAKGLGMHPNGSAVNPITEPDERRLLERDGDVARELLEARKPSRAVTANADEREQARAAVALIADGEVAALEALDQVVAELGYLPRPFAQFLVRVGHLRSTVEVEAGEA